MTDPKEPRATLKELNDVRIEMNALDDRFNVANFIEQVNAILREFEYQGLDVLHLTNEIFRRGHANKRTKEQIRDDISSMIILFLSRGNNITKMIKKSNDTGKIRIQTLQGHYLLQDQVGAGGTSVLTLSRIAAVFPVVTLKYLALDQLNIPRAVTLNTRDFGAAFPRHMQTVIAASVFPKGSVGMDLMCALLLYLIEENKILGKETAKADKDILKTFVPSARASFVSGLVEDHDRVATCVKLKLLASSETAVDSSLVTAVETFKRTFPSVDLICHS